MRRTRRPQNRLGDAPIVDDMNDAMNIFAMMFDEHINGTKVSRAGIGRKWGFVLLTFPLGEADKPENERCNFISNGSDRKDLCTLFREMIARFEGQPDYKPTGIVQ